jgi:hypothetical protein
MVMKSASGAGNMWIIYILLVAIAVPVVGALVLAIYASALIARPLQERMHRATMLNLDEPTEPRLIPKPGAAVVDDRARRMPDEVASVS